MSCPKEGAVCNPGTGCGAKLICATSDPKSYGCPISRAAFKRDIHYLGTDELRRHASDVLRMKLATWRYKDDPTRERLGFIIDDNEGSFAVSEGGDRVDLYGYTSLAVATLQTQAREIEKLKRKIAALETAVSPTPCGPTRRSR